MKTNKDEENQAFLAADELRDMILKRTGLSAKELQCPREKSDMTPCVARDGRLAVSFSSFGRTICVGCEHTLYGLIKKEREKGHQ